MMMNKERKESKTKESTHSASISQIVRQLLETSTSSGPVADSVKMPSLRVRFSTS